MVLGELGGGGGNSKDGSKVNTKKEVGDGDSDDDAAGILAKDNGKMKTFSWAQLQTSDANANGKDGDKQNQNDGIVADTSPIGQIGEEFTKFLGRQVTSLVENLSEVGIRRASLESRRALHHTYEM